METHVLKQEILLVPFSFSLKQLCEKNVSGNRRNLSQAEQLEEACWNGLLEELLGDIIKKSVCGRRLGLWQMHIGEYLLELELCNYQQPSEMHLSINPEIFMEAKNYN
ncbi:MAG: hypothetical protein ABIO55_04745 [Ginsengibacter sp.]